MRAGLLTEKISIYRTDVIQGEDGATNNIHTLIASTRANVISKGGARTIENDEVVYPYTFAFEVWGYIKIQEHTDYIMWGKKKYRVLSVVLDKVQNKKTIETEVINE